MRIIGNFPVVQWLGLQALTAKGVDSIPCQVTKILQAKWHDRKKKSQSQAAYRLGEEDSSWNACLGLAI